MWSTVCLTDTSTSTRCERERELSVGRAFPPPASPSAEAAEICRISAHPLVETGQRRPRSSPKPSSVGPSQPFKGHRRTVCPTAIRLRSTTAETRRPGRTPRRLRTALARLYARLACLRAPVLRSRSHSVRERGDRVGCAVIAHTNGAPGSRPYSGPADQPPAVVNDVVFVSTTRPALYAFDAETGL